MSILSKKLSIIEAKKKALEDEEALLIETRKKEVSVLLEKIPGALSQDNLILAGIIADGIARLEKNPSLEKEFKEIAYNLPSFRKPKSKSADESNFNSQENKVSAQSN
jgi:hypothetical protein